MYAFHRFTIIYVSRKAIHASPHLEDSQRPTLVSHIRRLVLQPVVRILEISDWNLMQGLCNESAP